MRHDICLFVQVNRLLYRSRQRGFLEMDLLVGLWAERRLPHMEESELAAYSTVLDQENPDLFKWLTGQEPAPDDMLTNPAFKVGTLPLQPRSMCSLCATKVQSHCCVTTISLAASERPVFRLLCALYRRTTVEPGETVEAPNIKASMHKWTVVLTLCPGRRSYMSMCRGSLRRTARQAQRQCRASPGCAAGTTAVSPSTSRRKQHDWAVMYLGLTSPCSSCCGERSGQGMCCALECMENRVCTLLCLCAVHC